MSSALSKLWYGPVSVVSTSVKVARSVWSAASMIRTTTMTSG